MRQGVAAMMLQKHVVAAPQRLEGRHRHQHAGAQGNFCHVFGHQRAIIRYVLQHVHHQHQRRVAAVHSAAKPHRTAIDLFLVIVRVAGIDAGRLSCLAAFKKLAGEEA